MNLMSSVTCSLQDLMTKQTVRIILVVFTVQTSLSPSISIPVLTTSTSMSTSAGAQSA